MALISFTQISDGTTAVAAGVNTPLTTIYNDYNGNITAANIAAATLTATQMATAINPETRGAETFYDFVASGCVITADAAGSTLLWSMTSGVVYIGGKRIVVNALSGIAAIASKDTYVDVDNTGTLTYTGGNVVANNAASSSLAANSVRLGIVVSGATNIAASTSINQGQETRVLPIASSTPYAVTDSLGNLICPRDPQRKILGYKQAIALATATTLADVPGLTVPVIVPNGRKVKISFEAQSMSCTAATGAGSYSYFIKEGATTLADSSVTSDGANYTQGVSRGVIITPSSGLHIYKIQISGNSTTATMNATTTSPALIEVELA